jgi:hypothetical protein
MTNSETAPQYNLATVEALILEVAAELHPRHLSARDLSLKVAIDPDDSREVETAIQAIRNLREFGLLAGQDDESVEPTPPALRAVLLFT